MVNLLSDFFLLLILLVNELVDQFQIFCELPEFLLIIDIIIRVSPLFDQDVQNISTAYIIDHLSIFPLHDLDLGDLFHQFYLVFRLKHFQAPITDLFWFFSWIFISRFESLQCLFIPLATSLILVLFYIFLWVWRVTYCKMLFDQIIVEVDIAWYTHLRVSRIFLVYTCRLLCEFMLIHTAFCLSWNLFK